MVDIHCHILPLVDDGAKSWEVAEQMCQAAWDDGTTHIVATPHANPHFEYNRELFSAMLAELQKKVKGKLGFSLGCDFHLSYENLEQLFITPERFLIEGTRYLLIELNEFGLLPKFEHLLFRMQSELRIKPILTHPERHPILQRHPEHVLSWIKAGCLVQVTANSLTGFWGPRAREVALWLLQRNALHLVASDGHDPHRRPPLLSPARDLLVELVGEETALNLVENRPRAVIKGREIPLSPLPLRK